MSKHDQRGNLVSYASQDAIDRLDRVFDLMHAYQADPLAEVDAIIAEHPDFAMAHAFRAGGGFWQGIGDQLPPRAELSRNAPTG